MAYMHPSCKTPLELESLINGFNGSEWERQVYRLLQDYLPSTWHVWWNKHQEFGGFRHQYDFIILVPDRGLVNLDAKGAGWTVEEGQTICRHNGEISIRKDIFDQAEKAQQTLWNIFAHKISNQWGACSHLLVFRHVFSYPGKEDRYIADLENELRRDPHVLERKICSVLAPFKAAFESFQANEAIIRRHLDAECQTSEPDNMEDFRSADEDAAEGLSMQQRKVRSLLHRHPNIHVVGAAGTGKTVVAMQLMRTALTNNKKVLYVCYNKALSEDLSARNPGLSDGENGVIVHFDAIPNRKIPGIGKMDNGGALFRIPEDDAGWENRRRQIDSMLEKQARTVFDMLIVDEAQDLNNDHIFSLFYLLKPKREIVVFSDAKQSLFVKNWFLDESMFGQDGLVELRLDENWRNTNVIHDRFRPFEEGNVHSMIFENARPVEFVSDAKTILEKVLSEGRRPCDIAILCASKNQFNSLPSFVSGTNGRTIKFTEDTSVWRNGSRILKTTVRAFKGLEAPIVVFCEGDLDEISEDRYVGESRAKYELYIVSERKGSVLDEG